MKRQLLKEMGLQCLWSLLIFGGLLGVLLLIETCFPQWSGQLLSWQDPAFVVGIPASVIGVAYVLTIRNPKNYMGFYLGLAMSILLSMQFYLRAQYDLVVLYTVVFIPFLVLSLVSWRRNTLQASEGQTLEPSFISKKQMAWVQIACVVLLATDYIISTKLLNHDGWGDNIAVKIVSGLMIGSSFFANYMLIHQKNDAWICWVIYSLAGIGLGILIHNMFSVVLFAMFLIINLSAQTAWLKITQPHQFGWVGSEERIARLQAKKKKK